MCLVIMRCYANNASTTTLIWFCRFRTLMVQYNRHFISRECRSDPVRSKVLCKDIGSVMDCVSEVAHKCRKNGNINEYFAELYNAKSDMVLWQGNE